LRPLCVLCASAVISALRPLSLIRGTPHLSHPATATPPEFPNPPPPIPSFTLFRSAFQPFSVSAYTHTTH
jgi:hypothetical protein